MKDLRSILRRNERLARNIVGTFSVRGLSLLIGLATLPAYLRFFPDRETLGVWFTLLAVFNLFVVFDLGIGNGLRTRVVKPLLDGDLRAVRELTASAYAISLTMSLLILLGGSLVTLNVDWNTVFSTSPTRVTPDEFDAVMMVLLVGIAIQVGLKNTTALLYATQRNNVVNLLGVASTLPLLAFLLLMQEGSLSGDMVGLAVANVIFTVVPAMAVTIWLFRSGAVGARPRWADMHLAAARAVLGIGSTFLAIQVSLVVITSTDQILISSAFDPRYVVDYQAYFKVFGTLSMLFSLLTQPVWSAVAEKWARGDVAWVARAARAMLYAAAVGAFVTAVVVALVPWIMDLWLGRGFIDVSYATASVFAVLAVLDILVLASTSIANGIGELRVQLAFTVLGALVKIPLTLVLVSVLPQWQVVVVGHVLVLVPLVIAQLIALRRQRGDAAVTRLATSSGVV